ncbi:MAG: GPP34 family phosphoprotein [Bacteroidales bacterium]|nr:GPP34 family phosphoprotein [Bacteroidales bacterium]
MNHKVTEHFISLSLNPESGRYLILGNYLTYGIIGAILMDLSLAGRISIENHDIIPGKDLSSTGIPAFDRMLSTISESGKLRNIKTWIRRLGNKAPWYRKEMQKNFVDQGILKAEKKRFIGIPYRLHYVARPGYRKNLIIRYKEVILYNKIPEDHEIMVIGLMFACKMHRVIARGGTERRNVRKKIVEIIRDNKFANDINQAIMEVQAAITASIAATAAMSAATASSGGN